jgi:AraC-like DNA-binding protein
MVYSPGMEIDGITWSDFNVFTFSLTLEMIENLGKVSGYPGGRNLFCNTDVLTCHRSVIRKFRQLLRSFCSQIENGHSAVVKHEFYGKFNSEILDQLLAAIVSSRPVKYSDSSRLRDRALKKAITYISEFSQECPTVQMISQETDVTTRTLEYAFLERFGVPPKTYLQAFRLNGVYREFRRRDPSSTKVIDVANHWGFWHMGQFASDYRKLFGELPSETLRKP